MLQITSDAMANASCEDYAALFKAAVLKSKKGELEGFYVYTGPGPDMGLLCKRTERGGLMPVALLEDGQVNPVPVQGTAVMVSAMNNLRAVLAPKPA